MSDATSLIPPSRLGALLTEQRTQRGLTVEELCLETGLPFSADELRRIEQGQLTLSDDQVHRLMTAYQASSGPLVPDRSELVVDLHHGAMFAGARTRVLPADAGFDDILGRYLSLLYLMRGLEPGRRLSLRGDDLEVLAAALERNIAEIEGRLFELMLPGQVAPWFSRFRHRLAVPAAGILVGLTTVGSLVFVQFPAGSRGTIVSGTAAPDVGTPEASLAAAVFVDDAELLPAVARTRESTTADVVEFTPGDPASIGAAAEALIAYDFRAVLADWTFVYDGPRDGYRGNTNTVTRTISVYVSDGDTPQTVADVVAHEVGHAIDVMYLGDAQRRAWLEQRGIESGWWPHSGASDFHVGAGDFAEAVAATLIASPSDSEHGGFTAAQLAFVADLLP